MKPPMPTPPESSFCAVANRHPQSVVLITRLLWTEVQTVSRFGLTLGALLGLALFLMELLAPITIPFHLKGPAR
jgi:hypothetical protein